MLTKFVARLLDDADTLLGWAQVDCVPKPQKGRVSGVFRPVAPTQFVIETAGRCTRISIHWCDLDIARVMPIAEPVEVLPYQMFTFTWLEPVWVVSGQADVPLPATVHHHGVLVGIPSGTMTAAAGR